MLLVSAGNMARIVAVAVLPLNRAVLAMDDELGSLVAAAFPAGVYRFPLVSK